MALLRCSVVTLLAVIFGSVSRIQAGPQSQTECVGRLKGADFAYLIPEYFTWQELFETLKTTPTTSAGLLRASLGLSDAAFNIAASTADAALRQASALGSSARLTNGAPQHTTAADSILEYRDDLLRSLSESDAQALIQQVEARRNQLTFAFPKPGRRVTSSNGPINCPVSVDGKIDAELIPEAFYWEFHFRILASISESHRIGPASYDKSYLDALREQRLPIPLSDVLIVLGTSVETTRDVDAIRGGQPFSDAEPLVARRIQLARLGLLRKIPRSSWMVVQRDAAGRRAGISYTFPSSY